MQSMTYKVYGIFIYKKNDEIKIEIFEIKTNQYRKIRNGLPHDWYFTICVSVNSRAAFNNFIFNHDYKFQKIYQNRARTRNISIAGRVLQWFDKKQHESRERREAKRVYFRFNLQCGEKIRHCFRKKRRAQR